MSDKTLKNKKIKKKHRIQKLKQIIKKINLE